MKLKKLLKHIGFIQRVQILDYCNGKEEVLFEGFSTDVPWTYANMYLDTDDNGEAIGTVAIDNDSVITIYVRETKEPTTYEGIKYE